MRLATVLWGAAFVGGAVVVGAGWAPGSGAWAPGPRVGVVAVLATLGVLLLLVPLVRFAVLRGRRVEGEGGCPVGAKCACGHFNFKPRPVCRQCGKATAY